MSCINEFIKNIIDYGVDENGLEVAKNSLLNSFSGTAPQIGPIIENTINTIYNKLLIAIYVPVFLIITIIIIALVYKNIITILSGLVLWIMFIILIIILHVIILTRINSLVVIFGSNVEKDIFNVIVSLAVIIIEDLKYLIFCTF